MRMQVENCGGVVLNPALRGKRSLEALGLFKILKTQNRILLYELCGQNSQGLSAMVQEPVLHFKKMVLVAVTDTWICTGCAGGGLQWRWQYFHLEYCWYHAVTLYSNTAFWFNMDVANAQLVQITSSPNWWYVFHIWDVRLRAMLVLPCIELNQSFFRAKVFFSQISIQGTGGQTCDSGMPQA